MHVCQQIFELICMNVENNRAGCLTRNLSCCYDDGIDHDSNADRKHQQIDDTGYFCCDRSQVSLILGYDQAIICILACHNNYNYYYWYHCMLIYKLYVMLKSLLFICVVYCMHLYHITSFVMSSFTHALLCHMHLAPTTKVLDKLFCSCFLFTLYAMYCMYVYTEQWSRN